MANPPDDREHKRQHPASRPDWRLILIWVLSALLLVFLVYLAIAFVMQAPEQERMPDAEEINAVVVAASANRAAAARAARA